MLLGGLVSQYRKLYIGAIEAAKKYLFFRPLNLENQDILLSGTVKKNAANFLNLQPEGQHLACFTGGMVGIAAKIFERPDDLAIARKLVDGCIWAYESMPTGIMPESFSVVPCPDPDDCAWSRERWYDGVMHEQQRRWVETADEKAVHARKIIEEDKLAPGFTGITDRRFLLRYAATPSYLSFHALPKTPLTQTISSHPAPSLCAIFPLLPLLANIGIIFLVLKPSSPSSSCTASLATRRCRIKHGACSKP